MLWAHGRQRVGREDRAGVRRLARAGEGGGDEPMEQFRAMLLAGAYSDFVTDMQVLKQAMGPAGSGVILTTTWHTPEPPAWVPYESSKAAKNRLVYALGHHLREKG